MYVELLKRVFCTRAADQHLVASRIGTTAVFAGSTQPGDTHFCIVTRLGLT